MKSRIITVLVSIAILLIGVAGFLILKATKPAPPEKAVDRVRPIVRVMEVKKGPYTAVVEESGNVEPKTSLEITAEVAGRLIDVSDNLRIGYFVKKGELLLEIDPREYRLSVAQSKAQIAQLEAEKSQIKQERANINRNLEVERQKIKLSRSELQRKKKLLVSGSLSQSEVDRQEIETKQQEVSLVNQENALNLLKSKEDLLRAKIEATQAQLEIAKLKLEKTKVLAPFDGRVSEESVEEVQYVVVGQKLATIYDISAVEITLNFAPNKMRQWAPHRKGLEELPPITDVASVNEWMRKYGPKGEVIFRFGKRESKWPCKVTRIKGALDHTTRTIPVVVEVEDPFKGVKPGVRPPLIPGMFVTVRLMGRVLENVVSIPRSAVQDGTVYVVEDGKLAIRKVKIEMITRDQTIISDGLKDGDKVILSTLTVPMPGTELRIAPES